MLHTTKKIKTRIKDGELEAFADGEWYPAFEGRDGITYEDGICEECQGEKTTWTLKSCGKPISMCCGGCYVEEPCEFCGGTGEQNQL